MTNPDNTSTPTHSTRMLRESGVFEPQVHASLDRTIVAGMFGGAETCWYANPPEVGP